MEIVSLIFCAVVIAFQLFIFSLVGKLAIQLRDLRAEFASVGEDIVLYGGPAHVREMRVSLGTREINIPVHSKRRAIPYAEDHCAIDLPLFDSAVYRPMRRVWEFVEDVPASLPTDVGFKSG